MTSRLDAALAARGLARSRTHAATLIADGLVTVDGRPVVKASAQVADDAALEVAGADHYVSRAAHKLIAGLDAFDVDVAGRLALDMGASTGGFTQVLRERGAERVIAVDVGHGQLAASVALDPGVISIEGFNVRYMTAESLAEASGVARAPERRHRRPFVHLAHPRAARRARGRRRRRRPRPARQAAVRGGTDRRQGRTRDGCRGPRRCGRERAVGGVGRGARHAAAWSPPRSPARTATRSTSRTSRRDAGAIRQNG